MLDIPKSVKELFKTDGVLKNFRVHFPDGEREDICNDQIVRESVKFQESLCSRDKIKFGYCEQSVLKFSCVGVENIKGMRIQAQYEIDVTSIVSTGIKYSTSADVPFPYYVLPLGIFYVDDCKMDASMEKRNVTAYSQAMEDLFDSSEDGKLVSVYAVPSVVKSWCEWDYSGKGTASVDIWNLLAIFTGSAFFDIIKSTFVNMTNSKTSHTGYITTSVYVESVRKIIGFTITCTDTINCIVSPHYSMEDWPECSGLYYINPLNTLRDYVNDLIAWLNTHFREKFNTTLSKRNEKDIKKIFTEYFTWTAYGRSTVAGKERAYEHSYERIHVTDGFNGGFIPMFESLQIEGTIAELSVRVIDGDTSEQIDFPEFGKTYKISQKEVTVQASRRYNQGKQITPWYKQIGLEKITETATTVNEDGKWKLNYFYTDSFLTYFKSMKDRVECLAQIAGFDRYGQYHLYSLKNGRGLFPSEELYPSDTLYPANEKDAGKVTRDSYISAWLDDEYIEFGSVTCVYTDASGEEVEYTKIIDEENYESMDVYDLSDNDYLQSCGTSGQYSIIKNAVDKIAEELTGFAYIPADVKMKGLPYIECGDSIWIRTKNGAYVTSVLQNTISGIQDIRQQIVSK